MQPVENNRRVTWLIAEAALGPLPSSASLAEALGAAHFASTRLRAGVAARAWCDAIHEFEVLAPVHADQRTRLAERGTSICCVGKYGVREPARIWLEACTMAKAQGAKLVLDLCDFPFEDTKPSEMRGFYTEALGLADDVVVNSEVMAELIRPRAARPPVVIEDPILDSPRAPAFEPRSRLELLWFGHQSNGRYLFGCIDHLIRFAATRRCRITAVTAPGFGVETMLASLRARAPQLDARFVPWSLEAQRLELRRCDLVLLPSDPDDVHKAGASSNRLGETLNAGRFPIASPLRSYLPYSEAAWLGADVVQGVQWALTHRGDVLARIRRGQALVAERLAFDRIAAQWRALFESLTQ